MQKLSDETLTDLIALIPLCAFGQRRVDMPETAAGLFSAVACDLSVRMREWWQPDELFLSMLKRVQLEAVAVESGASLRMGKLDGYNKKELIAALVRHFDRTANGDTKVDEFDRKALEWLPSIMAFAPSDQPSSGTAA